MRRFVPDRILIIARGPPYHSSSPSNPGGGCNSMVINVGLYGACLLSLYVLNTTKRK